MTLGSKLTLWVLLPLLLVLILLATVIGILSSGMGSDGFAGTLRSVFTASE